MPSVRIAGTVAPGPRVICHHRHSRIPAGEEHVMAEAVATGTSGKVVIRGIGACAKLSRRPLPVGSTSISRALSRSCI